MHDVPPVPLAGWAVEPIGYRRINDTTAGLDRIVGTLRSPQGDVRCSVFRKRLRRARAGDAASDVTFAGSDEPAHWNYWRRESDAYGSGLLREMAGGFRAPECFAREIVDDTATLWLQDVQGTPASVWSVERFALAMRHLGRFQGRFVAGEPLPAYPWLSRGHLRAWTPGGDDGGDVRYRRLCERRDELLAAVEASPATVCHLDLRSANMFAGQRPGDDDATVVVDWSAVGFGALGEDVASMVFDSVWMCDVGVALLRPLSLAAIDGYLAGLRDAGWTGDERVARRNYAAVAGLKFGLLAPRLRRAASSDDQRRTLEHKYGMPADAVIARRAAVCERALELAATILDEPEV